MQSVLFIAILCVLLASCYVLVRYGSARLEGANPVSLFTFIAILFTSGLDVGLIMFPLTEFPIYEREPAYQFSNPLSVAFGFWGFLIWAFYFLTTFYFCAIEPHVRLFEKPLIKLVNNIVIIGTCAFTGFLFLSYLPSYIDGISPFWQYSLVVTITLLAVLSSADIRYVKVLSVSSTCVFIVLIVVMWATTNQGLSGLGSNLMLVSEYFSQVHHFVKPVSDYHAFYLFWWFSWSIMIGQFVARFVGGLRTWQLLLALLVFPSIPIALWFSVLYYYHTNSIELVAMRNIAMIVVGVIFVINSLDSLIRLYTDNLKLSVDRVGFLPYVILNFVVIFGLIVLYQLTPLKIEWVGLVVIALYALICLLLAKRAFVH